LDLSAPSLGGVRLGDQEAVIAKRFGPPASLRDMKRKGIWHYPVWGIAFEVERGRVVRFGATALGDEGQLPRAVPRGWRAYRGEVVLRQGGPRRRVDRLRPEAFWEAFGAPHKVEEGSEEVVLYYRFGGWGMDVGFLPDERFIHVSAFLSGRSAV
jgi:hypothetical protein